MKASEHIKLMLESGSSLKDIDKFLDNDYRPAREGLKHKDAFSIRKLFEENKFIRALPGMRCVQQTSYDLQSGPIYCGRPASVCAEVELGMFVIFCEQCLRRHI